MLRFFYYFSKAEIALWFFSVLAIVVSFCAFDRTNYMTLCASLIGVTSLIFNANGNLCVDLLVKKSLQWKQI